MLLRSPDRSNALYFRAVSLVSLRLFISALPPAPCSTWSVPSAFPVHIVPCSTSCPGAIKNVGDDADRSLGTPASMRAKTHRWFSGSRGGFPKSGFKCAPCTAAQMPLACISRGAHPSAQPTHVRIDAAEVFGLLLAGIVSARPGIVSARLGIVSAMAVQPHRHRMPNAFLHELVRFSVTLQNIVCKSPRSSLGNNKRNGPPLQSHSAFELLAMLRTVTAAHLFAIPDRGGPSDDGGHVTQELLNTRAALGNGERHLGWAVEVACLGPYNDHTTSSRSIRASPLGRSSACSIPGVGTASAVGLPW